MNNGSKLTSVAVAACVACCTVGFSPLLLAVTSGVPVGGAVVKWGAIAVSLLAPIVGLLTLSRRKAAPQAS